MLDRQQLDQFHRDGLLVLRGVFGDDELRALWQAADQVQQDALAGEGSGHSILASHVLFSIQKELFATLAEQGHPRLRPRHGAVLAYLDADGSRATALAQQSGQHKQVIGTLVDELVELGYVQRQPDPKDRRAKLIVPTALGLDQMTRSDAIMAAIEQRHAQVLGEQAYADFKRAFQQVARLQRAW